MNKAQATVEFLIVFAITVAVVSMLASALLAQHEVARSKINDMERINRAEAAAQAIEAWLNAGVPMAFDFSEENVTYRVEQGRFHVMHEGSVIEIDGVFANVDTEPV